MMDTNAGRPTPMVLHRKTIGRSLLLMVAALLSTMVAQGMYSYSIHTYQHSQKTPCANAIIITHSEELFCPTAYACSHALAFERLSNNLNVCRRT